MQNIENFIKSYWEYFIELESQLIETRRFLAFDDTNAKAFSIEYLKLYQAVCSEIDVVGKEIAFISNPDFKVDNRTNIQKWGFEIQQKFPNLKDSFVTFNNETKVQPYKNWEYEKYSDKKGNIRLRIVGGKKAIPWWSDYNKVKHQRIGLVTGTKNFNLANQKNLILAYSALYALEITYLKSIENFENFKITNSKLFKITC